MEYPVSASPVLCGLDTQGQVTILVSTSEDNEPDFCVRIPVDWRERTQLNSTLSDTETIHYPVALSKEPVTKGLIDELIPTEEEWFLSEDLETGMLHVLITQGTGHLLVGTSRLPTAPDWEKRVTAVITIPLTLLGDAISVVVEILSKVFTSEDGIGGLFHLIDFLDIGPFSSDDDDSDKSPQSKGSGLINPSHPQD